MVNKDKIACWYKDMVKRLKKAEAHASAKKSYKPFNIQLDKRRIP